MTYAIQLCGSVLILWSIFVSMGYAAKLPPNSGVGGMPYQAPLQPMPHGVGANVSNNIQQTDILGPPDSAQTVAPAELAATEPDVGTAELSEQAASGSEGPGQARRVIVWVLIGVSVAVVALWLWFGTHRHVSNT